MKYRVAGRIAAASAVAISFAALATPAHAEKIANSYICVFKNDRVAKADVPERANAAARAQGGTVSHVYRTAIRGFAANISEAGMNAMRRNNPSIAYCEQDQVMSLVQSSKARPGGGGTTQPAQTTPWGIARVNGGAAGSFATAWVIDTGIDLDHPDLNVDATRSRNFISRDSSPDDLNGHGSHVAGTIAAYDNTIGVIGVAPGAKVVAVRVLDRRGSGTNSGVIEGVDYVAGAGAAGDVANMSLGGGVSTALDNAIGVVGVAPGAKVVAVRVLDRRGSGSNSGVIAGVDYVAQNGKSGDVANMSLGGGVSTALDTAVVNASANVRFALAAGNESDNANNHSPARANGQNVYTVSAFATGDKWASFSNYGNPPIDYAEPGVSIKSTWKDGGYNTISGTSMATPHLAGLLLAGAVRSGGAVIGDPDGNADPIGVK